jgi:hypothetical protein
MKGPVFTEVGGSSKPLQTELAFKWTLPSVDPRKWKQDIIRVKRSLIGPDHYYSAKKNFDFCRAQGCLFATTPSINILTNFHYACTTK